jgi:FkbM family methyltransferase
MLTPREFLHTLIWVKRHALGQMPADEVRALAGYLTPTDSVLDIGAHAGNWTVALSRMVPQGKVFAFEALPYYAKVLRATLRLLGRKNVQVVGHPALDDEREIEMVWLDPAGQRLTGYTHVRGAQEPSTSTVSVNSIVLDDFLGSASSAVRFIKIDIEGAELSALKGATRLLNAHQPVLYVEVNDSYCARYGHSASDVFAFLAEFGYEAYSHERDSWVSVDASTYGGEGDVWFLPRGVRLGR